MCLLQRQTQRLREIRVLLLLSYVRRLLVCCLQRQANRLSELKVLTGHEGLLGVQPKGGLPPCQQVVDGSRVDDRRGLLHAAPVSRVQPPVSVVEHVVGRAMSVLGPLREGPHTIRHRLQVARRVAAEVHPQRPVEPDVHAPGAARVGIKRPVPTVLHMASPLLFALFVVQGVDAVDEVDVTQAPVVGPQHAVHLLAKPRRVAELKHETTVFGQHGGEVS
mmetsp:Transcript_25498/g.73646  ORF Transcript_25498/g.73646 Transcript_25498/m.73646 type:complete len:220 (-) Transcript_25498:522-1181(-)